MNIMNMNESHLLCLKFNELDSLNCLFTMVKSFNMGEMRIKNVYDNLIMDRKVDRVKQLHLIILQEGQAISFGQFSYPSTRARTHKYIII